MTNQTSVFSTGVPYLINAYCLSSKIVLTHNDINVVTPVDVAYWIIFYEEDYPS